MREQIAHLLNDLDRALRPLAAGARLPLYHIGRSALVWKHGFAAATEDVDVVAPHGHEALVTEALRLFGTGTAKAREHGLYLQEVPRGLPPVWDGCFRRATEAAGAWAVIRLFHLDDHDFAVTKLKRFSTKDRQDLRELCDLGLLDPETLAERVRATWPFHDGTGKDEDPGAARAVANFRRVRLYLETGEWPA